MTGVRPFVPGFGYRAIPMFACLMCTAACAPQSRAWSIAAEPGGSDAEARGNPDGGAATGIPDAAYSPDTPPSLLRDAGPAASADASGSRDTALEQAQDADPSAGADAVNSVYQRAALADMFVRDGTFDGANFGATVELEVKTSMHAGFTRVAYLMFSLPSFSPASAYLRLRVRLSDEGERFALRVLGVDSTTWQENTATWASRPETSGVLAGVELTEPGPHALLIDLSRHVRQLVERGDRTLALALTSLHETKGLAAIDSRESNQDAPMLLCLP